MAQLRQFSACGMSFHSSPESRRYPDCQWLPALENLRRFQKMAATVQI